jgi:hypothetical protein
MIKLTKQQYDAFLEWARMASVEQCGVISCETDGKDMFIKEYYFPESLVENTDKNGLSTNNKIQDDIIRQNKYDIYILMHTHPKGARGHTGVSISDADAAVTYAAWYKEKINKTVLMGIASPSHLSFWQANEEKGIEQVGISIDGKKLFQPDIVREQSLIEATYEKVYNKREKTGVTPFTGKKDLSSVTSVTLDS